MYPVPAERSASIQSNSKWLLPVFTIKVNILCFVCTADASLWLDHLNHNVVCRKQPSIHVYVAWNIKIDISNFPVSKVTRQGYGSSIWWHDKVCIRWNLLSEGCLSLFTAVLWNPVNLLCSYSKKSWMDVIASWEVSHHTYLFVFWFQHVSEKQNDTLVCTIQRGIQVLAPATRVTSGASSLVVVLLSEVIV